jgi:hypothetical protein
MASITFSKTLQNGNKHIHPSTLCDVGKGSYTVKTLSMGEFANPQCPKPIAEGVLQVYTYSNNHNVIIPGLVILNKQFYKDNSKIEDDIDTIRQFVKDNIQLYKPDGWSCTLL